MGARRTNISCCGIITPENLSGQLRRCDFGKRKKTQTKITKKKFVAAINQTNNKQVINNDKPQQ